MSYDIELIVFTFANQKEAEGVLKLNKYNNQAKRHI